MFVRSLGCQSTTGTTDDRPRATDSIQPNKWCSMVSHCQCPMMKSANQFANSKQLRGNPHRMWIKHCSFHDKSLLCYLDALHLSNCTQSKGTQETIEILIFVDMNSSPIQHDRAPVSTYLAFAERIQTDTAISCSQRNVLGRLLWSLLLWSLWRA